ncbi:MAG: DNA alkylation repair protein [Candidatus Woesearchaeota archaeon]
MNISLEHFEEEFKSITTTSLKDCSSKDYQQTRYVLLCYRAQDIKSFVYEPYLELNDISKIEFLNSIILHSQISEIVTWALYEVDKINIEILIQQKKILLNWANSIENWWHSDQLSSIYNKILSNNRIFFKDLRQFNNFSSPWHRRLSITSLYYYAKSCKDPLPLEMTLPLVEKLLVDENYYVQKGIGWTLREMSQINYNQTLEFLKIHTKHIAPAGFSAALEKINEKDKEYIKQLRKKENSNPHEFEAHHSPLTIKYHKLKLDIHNHLRD